MGSNRPSDLQGSLQRDGGGIPGSSFAEDVANTTAPDTPTTPVLCSASSSSSAARGRRRAVRRGGREAGAQSAPLATASQSRRRLFKEQTIDIGSDVEPVSLEDPGGGEDNVKTELKPSTSSEFEHSQTSELTSSSSTVSNTPATINIDEGQGAFTSTWSSSLDSTDATGGMTPPPPPPPPQPPPPPPQSSSSSSLSSSSTAAAAAAAATAGSAHHRVLAARHLCPKCPKTFGSPGKLSQHMYSHTGERPFACQFCPKAFSSKFKLVRHMLIHSDQRQYTCQMCERTFHRKDHLKNHAKVHNPVKSTYSCDRSGCDKEYSSLLSYRKHIAVHAAEDGNLECTMCGLKFANKDEIVFHLKVHAGSRTVKTAEDRKYRCDHCDRSFFTGKDVRRHMVVHTGKRDFLCQFCPQRFGRKDHLVRHIKKSHNSTGKKTKVKRAEVKTKSVESILVETVRSKIQTSDIKPSTASKSATVTSGELFALSQEASLMSEFEESKDDKQNVFQSHFSDEHGCVVMIAPPGTSEVIHAVDEQIKNEPSSYISTSTSSSSAPISVAEISQCITVPSPAPVDVMSCRSLLSPTVRGSEIRIATNLMYEADEMTVSNDPRHQARHHSQHVYHAADDVVGPSGMQLTSDQYHPHRHETSFDQPAPSSSSSSSYSAMIDSFGLELKPEDLDDLKPSDLDLKADDLDLKPEDIGEVSENPTTLRETIAIEDLPLLIPILPRSHQHLHHEMRQMQATHFLASDETRDLSRHIIQLTAPGAASDNSELIVDFDIGSSEEAPPVSPAAPPSNAPSLPNTTPLPRFNQAFQQQPPPPPPQ